jgi:hypothetical protein
MPCFALRHVDHSHDLLDHRLGDDLYFHTNLNVCNVASRYLETCIVHGFALRYALAECSITSSCPDALREIA